MHRIVSGGSNNGRPWATPARWLARCVPAALCLALGCSSSSDRWKGLIYPNADRADDRGRLPFVEVGDFDSLDACSKALLGYIAANSTLPSTASYECGRRCKEADDGHQGLYYTYHCAERAGPMAKYLGAMRIE